MKEPGEFCTVEDNKQVGREKFLIPEMKKLKSEGLMTTLKQHP